MKSMHDILLDAWNEAAKHGVALKKVDFEIISYAGISGSGYGYASSEFEAYSMEIEDKQPVNCGSNEDPCSISKEELMKQVQDLKIRNDILFKENETIKNHNSQLIVKHFGHKKKKWF